MYKGFLATILTIGTALNLFNFEAEKYFDASANPIILDMDFCTDVDDAVSLRMATALDNYDVGSLMAVGLCTTDANGTDVNVRAVHGILCNDSYEDVPIGTAHVTEPDHSPYWDVCAEYSVGEVNCKDAVELYKEVLQKCVNPVTIVTTGYLNNIQYLLQDEEGFELVKNNCSKIVITGGSVPSGWDNNFGYTDNAKQAVKYVNANAPCDLIYVANDVGGVFKAGGIVQQLTPDDIIAKAITAYGESNGRTAWDPTAVFLAFVPTKASNFDVLPCEVQFYYTGENVITVLDGDIETNRYVVRRKDNVSIQQYQDLIEGIITPDIE